MEIAQTLFRTTPLQTVAFVGYSPDGGVVQVVEVKCFHADGALACFESAGSDKADQVPHLVDWLTRTLATHVMEHTSPF